MYNHVCMLCNLLHDWDGREDQTTNFNQSDGVTPEQNPHTPDGWCSQVPRKSGQKGGLDF